ncbi:hypothetical protein [Nocardia jinanensis]|uniref:hypothetical protein n=1 Tax=Nocardia jinanensis TaxID=382504 RepID=UPI0007389983|nr:hypothetical protein [Nocardia jinanensis]
MTTLHRPGALDGALPAAFEALYPKVVDENEPDRFFCVLYRPSTESVDVCGSILVSTRDAPVGEREVAGEADLYPEPSFHYEPAPEDRRSSYGEHAFITTTTDGLVKWALTADTLYVAIQYRPGEVSPDELWRLVAEVHARAQKAG